MSLDSSGKPTRDHRRELKDPLNISRLDNIEAIFKVEPEDETEVLFKDLAKVFMKGNKLKEGLGNMNPAAFIPVEEGAPVRVAMQRRNSSESTDVITFGLFKEACDWIAGRSQALDEKFFIELDIIDPAALSSLVTKTHKNINNSSDDWLTEFFVALSPIAGMMLATYIDDAGTINTSKAPVPDGENSGQQPRLYHSQGMPVGLALLIEAGAFSILGGLIKDQEVKENFEQLKSNPAERRKVLEDAGYDYESLTQNRKFDDYILIKQYCLNYISRLNNSVQYDHWIAWLNVVENQNIVRGALAMAPMYSKQWRRFSETNDVSSFTISEEQGLDLGDLGEAAINGLHRGLKDYFSSIQVVSDDHYNKTFQAYSMTLDSRLMCCIIWFLGPLDVETIRKMSEMLKLLSLNIKVDWRDFVARLTEATILPVINMISCYIGKIVDNIFLGVFEKLFRIPKTDFEAAIKKCIGINILFSLLDKSMVATLKFTNSLLNELEAMLDSIGQKGTRGVEIAVERRYLTSLAGLLDAVANKIDLARTACTAPQDLSVEKLNDIAAEAAVDFVSTQLTLEYPVLQLPEGVRRKFFVDVKPFVTSNLELEVPGLGELGEQLDLTREQFIQDCSEGNRAAEGILMGKKIADAMQGK